MSSQRKNPVSPTQKLAKSWRTIKQLKNLDPKEYDEDTMFLCRVSLIDINCDEGWCYRGCCDCKKSLAGGPGLYKCSRCGPIKRPIEWFKLKAEVQDATGTMDLMIFCEVAEELVGVSAEKLVQGIKNDDDWYTLPAAISHLLGSTHTFQVADKYGYGSFSVKSIMDHLSVVVPTATTKGKGKKKRVPEGSATTAEARSSRPQKPNKRLRGDDWTD